MQLKRIEKENGQLKKVEQQINSLFFVKKSLSYL